MPVFELIILQVVGPEICVALGYLEFPLIDEEDFEELRCIRRKIFNGLVLVAGELGLRSPPPEQLEEH